MIARCKAGRDEATTQHSRSEPVRLVEAVCTAAKVAKSRNNMVQCEQRLIRTHARTDPQPQGPAQRY